MASCAIDNLSQRKYNGAMRRSAEDASAGPEVPLQAASGFSLGQNCRKAFLADSGIALTKGN